MHIVVYGILLRSSLIKQETQCQASAVILRYFQIKGLPIHGVLAIQDLQNLLPTQLLMFCMASQIIQDKRDATGSGVMAFKHECVHFCSYVFIRETLLIFILKNTTFVCKLPLVILNTNTNRKNKQTKKHRTEYTFANRRMSKKSKFLLACMRSSSFSSFSFSFLFLMTSSTKYKIINICRTQINVENVNCRKQKCQHICAPISVYFSSSYFWVLPV